MTCEQFKRICQSTKGFLNASRATRLAMAEHFWACAECRAREEAGAERARKTLDPERVKLICQAAREQARADAEEEQKEAN